MIDLFAAKKVFERYVSNYNPENEKIKRKIIHTHNVVELSRQVTKDLNLSKEDMLLAELIALLHDIGRFEQIKRYNTYSDLQSIDHADFGVELLFKENLIRDFIKDDKYDKIIYKAIKNHNKYKIEDGLNEKELLHSKIIRDIDKIDILEGITIDNKIFYNSEEIKKQNITKEIFESFMRRETINRIYEKNCIDKILIFAAFVFDINFSASLQILKEKAYIHKMLNSLTELTDDTRNKIELVKKIIEEELKK